MKTHWLIRTTENLIAGPYSPDQVRSLIEQKKLHPNDEICPGNGYWFFLHEREELQKHFKMAPPLAPKDGDEEETQTDTYILENVEDLTPIPDLPDIEDPDLNPTTMLSGRAFKDSWQNKPPSTDKGIPKIFQPQILSSKIEKFSVWKLLTVILLVVVVTLVVVILGRFSG